MTQEQIFDLIKIILPFFLTTVVAPLVVYLISKLPAQQQSRAANIAMIAVQAAEQMATQQASTMSGPEKKALAIQTAELLLQKAHITLSEELISSFIESAVYLLNQTKDATTIVKPETPSQTFASPA